MHLLTYSRIASWLMCCIISLFFPRLSLFLSVFWILCLGFSPPPSPLRWPWFRYIYGPVHGDWGGIYKHWRYSHIEAPCLLYTAATSIVASLIWIPFKGDVCGECGWIAGSLGSSKDFPFKYNEHRELFVCHSASGDYAATGTIRVAMDDK